MDQSVAIAAHRDVLVPLRWTIPSRPASEFEVWTTVVTDCSVATDAVVADYQSIDELVLRDGPRRGGLGSPMTDQSVATDCEGGRVCRFC